MLSLHQDHIYLFLFRRGKLILAESVGFEPTGPFGPAVFKTVRISRTRATLHMEYHARIELASSVWRTDILTVRPMVLINNYL